MEALNGGALCRKDEKAQTLFEQLSLELTTPPQPLKDLKMESIEPRMLYLKQRLPQKENQ